MSDELEIEFLRLLVRIAQALEGIEDAIRKEMDDGK